MQYSTTFTYPDSPCLLPHWQHSADWCLPDTEELYQLNCQRRPANWIWENKQVTYTWNQEGYRAPNWDTITWANTHVVMGCSCVLGVGVNEPDTLPIQLAIQLQEPVVNLGFNGASPSIIQYNTLRMIELGWHPKTVTILIPELTRLTYFDDHGVQNLTPNFLGENMPYQGIFEFYRYWLRAPHHAELYGRMAIKAAEAMWNLARVPVVLRHITAVPQQHRLAPSLCAVKDQARDLDVDSKGIWHAHPGPLTLALWAREVADAIRITPPLL